MKLKTNDLSPRVCGVCGAPMLEGEEAFGSHGYSGPRPPLGAAIAQGDALTLDECFFYHVIDLPGVGTVGDGWDLRATTDDYLGRYDFSGKRVLEVGPASGYLTVEMERRGASVVSIEVPDDPGWDFVPFPAEVLVPQMPARREIQRKLKNSWHLVHKAFHSKAQIRYAPAEALPDDLGEFDVAVLGSLLTHTETPVRIIERCARRSQAIIITEMYWPDLEGRPVCLLNPSAENKDWGTWWQFSTDFFSQYLRVLGFEKQRVVLHSSRYHGVPVPLFALVGERSQPVG
jgi:hypothetical protein